VKGTSAISFWAGCFGNDVDATLNVDYSTDKGATWHTVGTVTATKGVLEQFMLTSVVDAPVRYRIAQTAGSRVNIDDVTLYAFVKKDLRGDVNGDGEVNIADANIVIDLILGGTADGGTMKRADVTGDGEIGIADINAIIDIILAS